MNKEFSKPPKSIKNLTDSNKLASLLSDLIGTDFIISGKSRTDGSRLRNLIAQKLEAAGLPQTAEIDDYKIVPPKKKGVPRILREFIDTYIITSGNSYNLQVWNRIPASNSLIIEYANSDKLTSKDVRFILVKIDVEQQIISSIFILSPTYIEHKFGKFGKPTIKQQLMISNAKREIIINLPNSILFGHDTKNVEKISVKKYAKPENDFNQIPNKNEVYALDIIFEKVAKKLIGKKINAAATKTRGQYLELLTLELLGYEINENNLLEGGYPDIRNQLLEIKIQDAQTVDLGKYSPEFDEMVISELNITSKDIRYLIALTDKNDEIIKGIILCSGEELINHFVFVADQSYKCQRSIPMNFFEKYKGKAVVNPD
jgi:hypothetical protein